jgi:6-pyruvoyltetrahydropterin/6-carboxytetrahydropterin synthase
MYRIAVRRDFMAYHFLIGRDWGKESERHSHQYAVELCLEGPELNGQGFLVDIDIIKKRLDRLLSQIEGRTLNDLPEIAGSNPSIERLAAYICDGIEIDDDDAGLASMTVKIWEDEEAWASCRRDLMQVP